MKERSKELLLGACVAVGLASAATATKAASNAQDEAAVRAAFVRYDDAWRARNAHAILAAFAPDFEYINSAGIRLARKPALGNYLGVIFHNAFFAAGTPGPLTIHAIRFPAPDVATVSSNETWHQQKDYATNKIVPDQKTTELTVFRRINGSWLIISDLKSNAPHP